MAYGFTASPQANITGTYTSHLGLTKFTLALWIRRDSSGSQQGVGFNSGSGVTETSHRSHITHFTDNRMYFVICNGSSTNVNGVSQSLTFSGSIPSSLSSNAVNQQLNIGWNRANNVYSVGAMAEFSTWEDALTAEEIASLSKGFTPSNIRPDKLLSHIPLLRNLQDVVAANALTNTSGNATVANHPRVYA
jgi:hypothetical protein